MKQYALIHNNGLRCEWLVDAPKDFVFDIKHFNIDANNSLHITLNDGNEIKSHLYKVLGTTDVREYYGIITCVNSLEGKL